MMTSIWIKITRSLTVVAVTVGLALPGISSASTGQRQQILAGFANQAKAMNDAFVAFSADRGRALFTSHPGTGKPDTPSCTTCHTSNPANFGRTRAGKEIAPMAISRTPDRFTDIEKVKKWFRRNCNTVLGRACTPIEKGDYLTFMISQ